MPLFFAIIIHLTTLTATLLFMKEVRLASGINSWQQQLGETLATIRIAFALSRRNPTITRLLGTTIAGGLALISLETFWQPQFAQLMGGSEKHTFFFGLIMGGNFIAGMAGNFLATPLSRRLKQRYGLVCAIFQTVRGLVIIGLAWQTTTLPAVLLFWLVYLNMGLINSPHSTLLNREIPPAQRSSMLSIESLAGYLGAIVGGIGLGYVAKHASINLAWTISGVVLITSLVLYL